MYKNKVTIFVVFLLRKFINISLLFIKVGYIYIKRLPIYDIKHIA